jgi:hypothetical protein
MVLHCSGLVVWVCFHRFTKKHLQIQQSVLITTKVWQYM